MSHVPTVSIALFPLPGLVLFPRTMLPLHIFEPRYIRMVRDALMRDRRIATANLRPGWQKEYFGAPPVHRTITIARILHEEQLPGEQYNILLEGIERAEVVEETRLKPYRLVKAASLVDLMDDADLPAIREEHRRLVAQAEHLAQQMPDLRTTLSNLNNQHLHPGIIADQVAAVLVRDPYERQSLLEQRRVLRRLQLMNVQLAAQLARQEDPHYEHWLDA